MRCNMEYIHLNCMWCAVTVSPVCLSVGCWQGTALQNLMIMLLLDSLHCSTCECARASACMCARLCLHVCSCVCAYLCLSVCACHNVSTHVVTGRHS